MKEEANREGHGEEVLRKYTEAATPTLEGTARLMAGMEAVTEEEVMEEEVMEGVAVTAAVTDDGDAYRPQANKQDSATKRTLGVEITPELAARLRPRREVLLNGNPHCLRRRVPVELRGIRMELMPRIGS